MKTLAQLFEIISVAAQEDNGRNNDRVREEFRFRGRWFVNFSGHVNTLSVTYYPNGWTADDNARKEKVEVSLKNEGGIQEAYWSIANRLGK